MVRGFVSHNTPSFTQRVAHLGKRLAVETAAGASRATNIYATPQLTLASLYGAARRGDVEAFQRCFSARAQAAAASTPEGPDAFWQNMMTGMRAVFADKSDAVLTPISGDDRQQTCYLGYRYMRGTFGREGVLGGWRLSGVG